ncbi:MAG: tRNA-dihydrouridine synthase family protein [Desulfamplus sp.]|nr:tRNA-dihydrouridine synthase family protein [Desulfamplus sp.]
MGFEIIMAPLQGCTDAVFRDVYFRHFTGVDQVVAPFISTMSQRRINISRLKDVLPANNINSPGLIPQILGNHAGDFLFLAENLISLGYVCVNWNLGCPHSKVANKKRGSGMLPFPVMVDEFLDHCRAFFGQSSCSLSIKLRLGRHDPDEIFRLLPIFEKYSIIDELILHPRTGVQMYNGKADPDAFGRVAAGTSHDLVYNGDMVSVSSFEAVLRRFPEIKRFMIGRGILANPFLPSEIKGDAPGRAEYPDRLKLFHDELFDAYCHKFYGPVHVTGRMKGFWSYLGKSFPGGAKAIKKMLKAKTREHYLAGAEAFFMEKIPFIPPG